MTNSSEVKPTNEMPNGGICYIFGVLYPVMYLLSVPRVRQNRFLRFHCFECLFLFILLAPLLCLKASPVSSLSLILVVGWPVAMIQARRGKMFRLPLLGFLAERLA